MFALIKPQHSKRVRILRTNLYAALSRAAEEGAVCPGDPELARITGYTVDGVSKALGNFIDAGLIEREAKGRYRKITIVATGKSTSWPVPKDEKYRYVPKRPVRDIARIAADLFSVPFETLTGTSRRRRHVRPRMAVYCVAADQGWAFAHIGRVLKRDHTTVLSGCESARIYSKYDPEFAQRLSRLADIAAPEGAL
jgi:hypothetical protein